MKNVSTLFLTGIIVLVFSGISFGAVYEYTTSALSDLDHYYAYSWKIDLIDENEYGFDNETETLDSVTLVFNDIYDNTDYDTLKISVLDSDDVAGGSFISKWNNTNVIGTQLTDGIYEYNDNNWSSNLFTSQYTGVKDGSDADTLAAELLFTLSDVDNIYQAPSDNPNLNSGANRITVTYSKNDDGTVKVEKTVIGDNYVPLTTSAIHYGGNVIDALTAYISENVLTLGLDPDCHFYTSSISLILNTSDTPDGISHAPEPETLVLFGLGLLGASAFGRKRFSSLG